MDKNKKVLVISGPTGVGENTLTNEIIKKFPIFKRLVAATTRSPRKGEKNKKDYYFMTKEQFFVEIKKGNIPEYQNNRNKNVYYGTYLPDLENKIENGYNIITTPDITGTKFFKKEYSATTIFIMPDSMDNLKKRHLHRNPDISKEELEKRLEYAKYEIENEAKFYDFEIVNRQGKIEKAVEDIMQIVKNEGYKLEK